MTPAACAFSRPRAIWCAIITPVVMSSRLSRSRRRLEVLAGEVLHDHVEADARIGADVEHVDDVLALDLAERARLAPEASDDELALLHRLVDQLDRDALAEIDVDGLADDAHAADAEHATDLVLAADGEADERAVRRGHPRVSKHVPVGDSRASLPA